MTTIPGIPYAAPPRAAVVASALSWPPRLVVIHDTSNTASAAAEANYAATRTDAQQYWTSAHAYIDQGGPLGSCPLDKQAWAAYSYGNQHGIHLEMCGMNAGAPAAVPPVTIQHTARLVAQLCDMAGIPKVHLGPTDVAAGKSGICGHYDITVGLGVGDHDDPGPAFDWVAFIAAVNNPEDDMPFLDDPNAAALAYRMDALMAGADEVRGGPTKGEPMWLVTTVKAVQTKVDELTVPQPAPVDAAAVAAALAADTGFLAALSKAVNDDAAKRLQS